MAAFIDNTVLTASTRALDPRLELCDQDFVCLVELTQSLLCHRQLVCDNSSRLVPEDQSSWERATQPWTPFYGSAILGETAHLEGALETAARLALFDAAAGRFTDVYRKTCAEIGVSPRKLIPQTYWRNGPDDAIFNAARKQLAEFDLKPVDDDPLVLPLARYVFRGYYYWISACDQNLTYIPCGLRFVYSKKATCSLMHPWFFSAQLSNRKCDSEMWKNVA